MSIKSTLFWAGIGGGIVALLVRASRRRAVPAPVIEVLPPDPEIEAAIDLQSLDEIEGTAHDVGELYGVSTPVAAERAHLDDDTAMEDGQNWVEALAVDAVLAGATPEQPIAITDDPDLDHSSLGSRASDDIPVADRGAGGPGGI